MPCLTRKTTCQPAWKLSKRRGFAASPINTARPQENQRLETRHVGASKRTFRATLPPIFTLSARYKTGCGMSQSATPAMQNDMTTCLETSKNERFCSFLHRHGEATGNQRLETRHVGASKRTFRATLPQIFRVGDRKGNVLQLPP